MAWEVENEMSIEAVEVITASIISLSLGNSGPQHTKLFPVPLTASNNFIPRNAVQVNNSRTEGCQSVGICRGSTWI